MQRLVEVVQRRARERAQRFVGRTLEVLVEGPSRTDPSRLRGRTRHNKVVNFAGLAAPGEYVDVEIHEATSQTLMGEQASLLVPVRADPSVRPVCEHMFVRWDGQTVEADEQARLPGLRGHRGGPPVRRARGARHPLLRGPGQERAQPRAREIARSVRVDGQPVPGLLPCVHLLHSGDTPVLMADGTTLEIADIRPGDRGLRHGAARRVPALLRHRGARPLDGPQARVPRDARGRHRARHERRPPVPHRPRVEARDRRGAGTAAAAAPHARTTS